MTCPRRATPSRSKSCSRCACCTCRSCPATDCGPGRYVTNRVPGRAGARAGMTSAESTRSSTQHSETKRLRVAMIGYGFMGATHSVGWRQAPRMFDLPGAVELTVIVGRNPARWRRLRPGGAGRSPRRTGERSSLATISTSSTSSRPATRTPRSRSPRSRPASTCCARSHSRTRSKRPRRWRMPPPAPPSTGCARWWGSPIAAFPR